MSAIRIELAVPSHAEAITALLRLVTPEPIVSRSILGATGMSDYLSHRLRVPSAHADALHLVALGSDLGFVGYAEVRFALGGLFLNHIAVHPDSQRLGIGRKLLLNALALAHLPRVRPKLSLDVMEDNSRVIRWYDALGFRVDHRLVWSELRGDGLAEGRHRPCLCSGLPQADAVHDRFGFSEFEVHEGDVVHRVGRLGDRYFRVRSVTPGLVQVVRRLDPQRRILRISAVDAGADASGWVAVAASERRSVSVHALAAALRGRDRRVRGSVGRGS